MAIAIYTKEDPAKFRELSLRQKRKEITFYGFLAALGFFSILFAVVPFAIWHFKTLPYLNSSVNQFPVPKNQVLSVQTIQNSQVQVIKDPDGFSYFVTTFKPSTNRPKEFTVTIPKLKIDNAKALVDSNNFDNNLALFPGSALPGEIGNAFVTGHSALPKFFDEKNYKTIFSRLPELEVGDDVYVEIEGRKYQFTVQYKKIVDPKDTSVLAPISDFSRNLTLMTCVPPGSSSKRMVVVTSLI